MVKYLVSLKKKKVAFYNALSKMTFKKPEKSHTNTKNANSVRSLLDLIFIWCSMRLQSLLSLHDATCLLSNSLSFSAVHIWLLGLVACIQFASFVLDSTPRFHLARTSKAYVNLNFANRFLQIKEVKEMESKHENPPPYSEAHGKFRSLIFS